MAETLSPPYLDQCGTPSIRSGSDRNSPHIAIIGAGLAGLAVAIVLARSGFRVSLFERFEQAQAVGAGLLLQPSGLAVLRHLGLLPQVEALGQRIDGLVGDSLKGTQQSWLRIMDLHYAELKQAPPGLNFGLGIHRANLYRVLLEAAEQAGARIHCGIEISQIGQHGTRHLLLDRAGRDYGCCDAVIIANGSHGQLRKQLNLPQRCALYPWGAMWTTLPDTLARPLLQQRYIKAHTMVGVLPSGPHPLHGEPCLSFFWSLPASAVGQWQQPANFRVWKTSFNRLWPELAPLLEPLSNASHFSWASYADVFMPSWHQGSILCVGDAAHGMSPQLGQGTNLALLDAWVLGDCMQQTDRLHEAFARYSVIRRRHLRFYQQASRWLTPLFQSHSRIAATMRDLSLPPLHRLNYTQQEMLRTIAGLKTGWVGDADVALPEGG